MMESRVRRVPSSEERRDLLRSLTLWTGRRDIAEDLVQQTLFEAWRSDRQPERDAEGRPWLFGVARNMLLRWRRDAAKHGVLMPGPDDARFLDVLSAADDLDSLLTSSEMVGLLDDLLGRLPAETRHALVLKYAAELPQAEVARRLGIHEKALEGRLHRGRQALKRLMVTERPDTVIDLGIISEPDVWQDTVLVCPSCGKRRLSGRWFERGGFQITCRDCASSAQPLELLVDVSDPTPPCAKSRTSLSRATRDALAFWSPAHRHGIETTARCTICNRQVAPRLEHRREPGSVDDENALYLVFDCPHCPGPISSHTVAASGLLIAEGQSFWHRHGSIHSERSQVVNWQGTQAIESVWRAFDVHRYTTWYSMETGALLALDEDGVGTDITNV